MFTITGPQGLIVFYTDSNGYIVTVMGEQFIVNGSPLVVTTNPPITPEVNLGTLYQVLLALLQDAMPA